MWSVSSPASTGNMMHNDGFAGAAPCGESGGVSAEKEKAANVKAEAEAKVVVMALRRCTMIERQ